jgi:hypothetical protein
MKEAISLSISGLYKQSSDVTIIKDSKGSQIFAGMVGQWECERDRVYCEGYFFFLFLCVVLCGVVLVVVVGRERGGGRGKGSGVK